MQQTHWDQYCLEQLVENGTQTTQLLIEQNEFLKSIAASLERLTTPQTKEQDK